MKMTEAKMEEYTTIFQALSDPTRLRIIWILVNMQLKICVCEIMDVLNESHYKVSRHLKVLKITGLLGEEKEGRWVFYFLKISQNPFLLAVLGAIKAIPRELFTIEIERCRQQLLSGKVRGCRVGVQCDEWKAALKRLSENT
jgi:ArsR family transcriptional regulator, arsenate/arsenite/antimonite-responsive transcriptional repressor